MKKALIYIVICILFASCDKDNLSGTLNDVLYVQHQSASTPAYIHGNGGSKVFIVVLHGGPGGNGLEYRNKSDEGRVGEGVGRWGSVR